MFFVTRESIHFRPEITVGVLEQCFGQVCMFDVLFSSSHTPDSILVSAMTVLLNLK